MDRVGAGDLGGGDDVGDAEVGQPAGRRADADVVVGEADVQRLAVGLAVDRDGLDAELAARADHPQGDLPAVGDQDLLEHQRRQVAGDRRASPAAGDLGERAVGGRVDARHPERELARVGRVEQRALVGDHAVLEPLHQRLVERLHAVGHRALGDQVGDVERLLDVADVVRHRRGVDQHLARRHPAPAVGARHQAQRHHRLQRGGEQRADLLVLVRRIERDDAVDRLGRVGGVQRARTPGGRCRPP